MTDVTRGEFDFLKEIVLKTGQRLDAIDASGTRGMGGVLVQLAAVAHDLAELKVDVQQDRRDRTSSRRWQVTTTLAILGLLLTLIGLVLYHHAA